MEGDSVLPRHLLLAWAAGVSASNARLQHRPLFRTVVVRGFKDALCPMHSRTAAGTWLEAHFNDRPSHCAPVTDMNYSRCTDCNLTKCVQPVPWSSLTRPVMWNLRSRPIDFFSSGHFWPYSLQDATHGLHFHRLLHTSLPTHDNPSEVNTSGLSVRLCYWLTLGANTSYTLNIKTQSKDLVANLRVDALKSGCRLAVFPSEMFPVFNAHVKILWHHILLRF